MKVRNSFIGNAGLGGNPSKAFFMQRARHTIWIACGIGVNHRRRVLRWDSHKA